MEEDADLKLLEQRKLEAQRRKLKTSAPQEKKERSDAEVLRSMLYDRGEEVLDAAYQIYPKETGGVVGELARMIRDGRLTERISGGELMSVFRQVGLRFRLETSIKVQDKGKFVDISERFGKGSE